MCRNSSRAVPAALFSVNSATKTAKKTGTSSVGKTLASKTQDKLIERASVVRCSRGFAEAVLLRRKYAVMKDVATADEPVVLAPQQKDRVDKHNNSKLSQSSTSSTSTTAPQTLASRTRRFSSALSIASTAKYTALLASGSRSSSRSHASSRSRVRTP